MNKKILRIIPVENGFILIEGDQWGPTYVRQWVARDIWELSNLVRDFYGPPAPVVVGETIPQA